EARGDRPLLAQGARCRSGVLDRCFGHRAVAFFETAEFARDSVPPSEVVATVKEATFSYYSHHRVVSQMWLLTYHGSDLVGYLTGANIRYVFLAALAPSRGPQLLAPQCARFSVVYQHSADAVLLKLEDADLPPDRSACRLIDAWPKFGEDSD